MAIGFNSIQLVADLIFKKVFCRKKESAFFSASMKTGVKLLGGTVTRVCEYSLRHSRPKVSVNVWQDRSCRTRGPLICEKQIEIILLGHICFISHLFTKSIQDTYTGTNLKFIDFRDPGSLCNIYVSYYAILLRSFLFHMDCIHAYCCMSNKIHVIGNVTVM